jgi:Tol biopolymer transport system component
VSTQNTLAVAAVLIAASIPLRGHDEPSLGSAALAWDRGDYVGALTTYLQVLDGSPSASAIETIALQTGELYKTTELTSDGDAPQFSPDGRLIAYETGGFASRRTRIVEATTLHTIAELNGFSASFSPDSATLAYLRIDPSDALLTAQAQADAAPAPERAQRQNAVTLQIAAESQLVIRDVASGQESTIDTGTIRKTKIAYGRDRLVFSGWEEGAPTVQIYDVAEGRPPRSRTSGPPDKDLQQVNATGSAVIYTHRLPAGGRAAGAGTARAFGVLSLDDGRVTTISGASPSFSPDGSSLTYVGRDGANNTIVVAPTSDPSSGTVSHKGVERLDAPVLSPDGARVAFQAMPKDDWEIFVANRDGSGKARVTREIQHDVLPMFLTDDRLLGSIGEPRHRRSYLYDLSDLSKVTRTRLFHNNTVRTIAPEYAWVPDRAGDRILIVSERDGDTVSPARGVYVVDLSRHVTRDELRDRIKRNLASEQELIALGRRLYAPIASDVKQVVSTASIERVYAYEKTLFDFDSKFVTQPGNKLAASYLFDTYKSFGYSPEYQTFTYRVRGSDRAGPTANVIATLKGTVNPELVYVVSSHYDSVAVGPGADDDSSGTAALLETARLLANHPQPATIVFASFTGEEAGLLGSREFVRRAVEDKVHVVGALNNDMIGWANDYRLDNTIRYSNPGIRDVQHAAAMQFSKLITYDALYYKSTDAAAFYEAYGDIVGGIGSYPVLGNPHYHQPHDLLEGINHQLVTEVAKTTAATLMLLASSPSRLKDLRIDSFENGVAGISWTPSPESGVTAYIVAFGPANKPEAQQRRVTKPATTVRGVASGTIISVKAVNAKGLEGWDWARVTVR